MNCTYKLGPNHRALNSNVTLEQLLWLGRMMLGQCGWNEVTLPGGRKAQVTAITCMGNDQYELALELPPEDIGGWLRMPSVNTVCVVTVVPSV